MSHLYSSIFILHFLRDRMQIDFL